MEDPNFLDSCVHHGHEAGGVYLALRELAKMYRELRKWWSKLSADDRARKIAGFAKLATMSVSVCLIMFGYRHARPNLASVVKPPFDESATAIAMESLAQSGRYDEAEATGRVGLQEAQLQHIPQDQVFDLAWRLADVFADEMLLMKGLNRNLPTRKLLEWRSVLITVADFQRRGFGPDGAVDKTQEYISGLTRLLEENG